MRLIGSLIVVVALVGGQAMAADNEPKFEQVQLQPDGSLVAHPEPAKKLDTDELEAGFKELEFYDKARTPVSDKVAKLLYTAEDKSVEIINGLTVDELIAENSFNPVADCSQEALIKRADIYYKSIQERYVISGPLYGVNVYTLKCLMMAANYCVANKDEVVKAGVATDKFMGDLYEAYLLDNKDGGAIEEESFQDDVYLGVEPYVAVFLKRDLDTARSFRRYRPEGYF